MRIQRFHHSTVSWFNETTTPLVITSLIFCACSTYVSVYWHMTQTHSTITGANLDGRNRQDILLTHTTSVKLLIYLCNLPVELLTHARSLGCVAYTCMLLVTTGFPFLHERTLKSLMTCGAFLTTSWQIGKMAPNQTVSKEKSQKKILEMILKIQWQSYTLFSLAQTPPTCTIHPCTHKDPE